MSLTVIKLINQCQHLTVTAPWVHHCVPCFMTVFLQWRKVTLHWVLLTPSLHSCYPILDQSVQAHHHWHIIRLQFCCSSSVCTTVIFEAKLLYFWLLEPEILKQSDNGKPLLQNPLNKKLIIKLLNWCSILCTIYRHHRGLEHPQKSTQNDSDCTFLCHCWSTPCSQRV